MKNIFKIVLEIFGWKTFCWIGLLCFSFQWIERDSYAMLRFPVQATVQQSPFVKKMRQHVRFIQSNRNHRAARTYCSEIVQTIEQLLQNDAFSILDSRSPPLVSLVQKMRNLASVAYQRDILTRMEDSEGPQLGMNGGVCEDFYQVANDLSTLLSEHLQKSENDRWEQFGLELLQQIKPTLQKLSVVLYEEIHSDSHILKTLPPVENEDLLTSEEMIQRAASSSIQMDVEGLTHFYLEEAKERTRLTPDFRLPIPSLETVEGRWEASQRVAFGEVLETIALGQVFRSEILKAFEILRDGVRNARLPAPVLQRFMDQWTKSPELQFSSIAIRVQNLKDDQIRKRAAPFLVDHSNSESSNELSKMTIEEITLQIKMRFAEMNYLALNSARLSGLSLEQMLARMEKVPKSLLSTPCADLNWHI